MFFIILYFLFAFGVTAKKPETQQTVLNYNEKVIKTTNKKSNKAIVECKDVLPEYTNQDVTIAGCTLNFGIKFSKCNVEISGTTFNLNSTQKIEIDSDSSHTTFMADVKIVCSGLRGSAVLVLSGDNKKNQIDELSIKDAFFERKTTDYSIISLGNAYFSLNKIIFLGDNNGTAIGGTGNGDSASSTIVVKECDFSNFPSSNLNILDLSLLRSPFTFENCHFIKNKCCVIKSDNLLSTVKFIKCNFEQSTHTAYAISISQDAGHVIFDGCTFNDNEIGQVSYFFAYTTSVEFVNTNTFSKIKMTKSASDYSKGAALYIHQGSDKKYTLSGLVFNDCYSSGSGGAIWVMCIDQFGDFHNIQIEIKNCIFTDCKAAMNGGAIFSGDDSYGEEDPLNTNDIDIYNCSFIRCEASKGGALYFQDGTKEGNEETYIYNSIFDACKGKKGSALFCRSYKFSMDGCVFKNHITESSDEPSAKNLDDSPYVNYIYINLNEDSIKANVTNCTFFENSGEIIEFYCANAAVSGKNSITFSKCNFSNNNHKSSFSVIDLDYIKSDTLEFKECTFKNNKNHVIFSLNSVSLTKVTDCLFESNFGFSGSAICLIGSAANNFYLTLQGNTFNNNTCTGVGEDHGGAIFAFSHYINFAGNNYFYNNSVFSTESGLEDSHGGAIYILQINEVPYQIENCHFENCFATNSGGALFFSLTDQDVPSFSCRALVNKCTFINCSTVEKGGAICNGLEYDNKVQGDNDMIIRNCTFTKCQSKFGGGLYFHDGTEEGNEETFIDSCVFDGCLGTNGTALFCRSYKFFMNYTTFMNHERNPSGDLTTYIYINLNEKEVNPSLEYCVFHHNDGCYLEFYTGASASADTSVGNFKKCNFSYNNLVSQNYAAIDLDHFVAKQFSFNDCDFTFNGGHCVLCNMYQVNVYFNRCNFNNNTGTASGVCLYLNSDISSNGLVNLDSCKFIGNKVNAPSSNFENTAGAIYTMADSIKFIGTNIFTDNRVESANTEMPEICRGGAIQIIQVKEGTLNITNLEFTNCHAAGSGGALFASLFDSTGNKKLFVNLFKCKFTGCSAGIEGGAVSSGEVIEEGKVMGDNDMSFEYCNFSKCSAPKGGALYFQDGTTEGNEETLIKYCTFDGNTGKNGTALFCRSYSLSMSHCTFKNHIYEFVTNMIYINLNEGVISSITSCTFEYNTLASYEMYSKGKNGQFDFEGCIFSHHNIGNEASGAIFHMDKISTQLLNIKSCQFEQNGGHCIMSNLALCKISIEQTNFNLNHATTSGCVFHFVCDGIDDYVVTIKSCSFTNNIVITSQGFDTAGAIYSYATYLKFYGRSTFTNNTVKGVVSDLNDVCHGGALYILQDQHRLFEIANCVFNDCYSAGSGGAIYFSCFDSTGNDQSIFVTVLSCTFSNCSAGVKGGAISSGQIYDDGSIHGDNDMAIKECTFTHCSAPSGGALYFHDGTAEGNEETKIEKCTFDNNNGKNGTSIFCRSWKFDISHTTFKNHLGDQKYQFVSYLYINLNEPNIFSTIQDCIFENNKRCSIEYICGKANDPYINFGSFNNCTFRNNNEGYLNEPCVNLEYIFSDFLFFQSCTFNNNKGFCLRSLKNKCNVTLSSCKFNNNTGLSGVCIFIDGDADKVYETITVIDCSFIGNVAKLDSQSSGEMIAYQAGAIYALTSMINFGGVNTFIENSVSHFSPEYSACYGGAIHLIQAKGAQFKLTGCVFTKCTSINNGGAIYFSCHDENHPTQSSLWITIESCTFNQCSAAQNGGAICSGEVYWDGGIYGDNDMIISKCTFNQCNAINGGGVYFQNGTPEGDEETVIRNCTFVNCQGTKGLAVYTQSYKNTIDNVVFRGHVYPNTAGKIFLYVQMDEAGVQPSITNCVFDNNDGSFISVNCSSYFNISKCTFKNYKNGDCISMNFFYVKKASTFHGCTFTNNGATCVGQSYFITSNINIDYCTFQYNNAPKASCLSVHSPWKKGTRSLKADIYKVIVKNCIFQHNRCGGSGSEMTMDQGAAYIDNSYCTITNSQFINCSIQGTSGHGGGLFICQDDQVAMEISGLTFDGCYAGNSGGGMFIECYDEDGETHFNIPVTVKNVVFNNCRSGVEGGGISCGLPWIGGGGQEGVNDNDVKLIFCTFSGCSSKNGGGAYFQDGTKAGDEETQILYCTFENNTADVNGSALYSRSFRFEMNHTTFKNNNFQGAKSKSFIYIVMNEDVYQPRMYNCTFNDNQNSNIYVNTIDAWSERTNLYINNSIFTNYQRSPCIAMDHFIVAVAYFTKCEFCYNSYSCVSGSNIEVSRFIECDFHDNKFMSGAAFYLSQLRYDVLNNVAINNCRFRKCVAVNEGIMQPIGGAIYAESQMISFEGYNEFIDCTVSDNGNMDISGASGGAICILQTEDIKEVIENIYCENCHARYSGGGLFASLKDYNGGEQKPDSLFLELRNCTFYKCTADVEGGGVSSGLKYDEATVVGDNDMKIINCRFIECEAPSGGAIYFQDGTKAGDEETYIEGCYFENNKATDGMAIYSRTYIFNLTKSTFTKHIGKGENDLTNMITINMNEYDVVPNIWNCIFDNNTYSTFKITTVNNQNIETVINNCTWTNYQKGSPALNLNDLTFQLGIFNNCTFENNKEYSIFGVKLTTTFRFNKCYFLNNEGKSAPCLYLDIARGATTNSVQIIDCLFQNNHAYWEGHSSVPNAGCIYSDTSILYIKGNNKFINNSCKNIEGKSRGGAIYLRQSQPARVTLSDSYFESCSAQYSGGAIFVACYDPEDPDSGLEKVVWVTIQNCSFFNCSSGTEGGAISSGITYSTSEAYNDNDMTIDNCTFNQCSSKNGGALYFQDGTTDGDEETIIQNCVFNNCSATTYGSCVYSRSYKFKLLNSIFQNNKANSFYGIEYCLYIHMNEGGVTPEIDGCIFENNEFIGTYIYCIDPFEIKNTIFRNHTSNNYCTKLGDWNFKLGTARNCTWSFCKGGACSMNDIKDKEEVFKFINCTFNNNTASQGGAVNVAFGPTIYFTSCIFKGNSASSTGGGALYVNSAHNAIFDDVSFIDNNCTDTNPSSAYTGNGGALYMAQSKKEAYTAKNCYFQNNVAARGGGIFFTCYDEDKPDSSIPMIIENMTFVSCHATIYGGGFTSGHQSAQYISQTNDICLISCKFIDCYAKIGGGVYFLDGTEKGDEETNITSCIFDNCKGENATALFSRSYKFGMFNTTFKNNKNNQPYTLIPFCFIQLDEYEVTPIVDGCTFENNGGSSLKIYSYEQFVISNCVFKNYPYGTDALILNDIEVRKGYINNCMFTGNQGRCVYGTRMWVYDINNCTFVNNTGDSGSACYISNGFRSSAKQLKSKGIKEYLPGRAHFSNCSFKDCSAKIKGCVYADSSMVDFKVTTFINCSCNDGKSLTTTESRGGGLYINQDYEELIAFTGVSCIDCYAHHSGGAIFIECYDQEGTHKNIPIKITGCNFTRCKAGNEGGAISSGYSFFDNGAVNDNDMIITNCSFVQCNAPKGGAMYFQDGTKEGDEETEIDNCIFDGCNGTQGCALYTRSYKFSLKNTVFKNNKGLGNGESETLFSFLYINMNEDDVTPYITNCTFENNTLTSIEIHSKQAFEITDCIFKNYPKDTECINLNYWSTTQIKVKNCTITGCKSTAIIAVYNTCEFINCTFKLNDCTEIGSGASCVTVRNGCAFTLSQCLFISNRAKGSGGVISGDLSALTMNYCVFTNNTCTGSDSMGGAINLIQNLEKPYTIKDCIFTDNTADYGGAVFVQCTDEYSPNSAIAILFTNCTFTGCKATKEGGGISSGHVIFGSMTHWDNDVTIKHCTFTSCSSKNGGACYFQDGTEKGDEETVIEYCIFDNCKATEDGASIYSKSYKFSMSHNIFKNHKDTSTIIKIIMNEKKVSPVIENNTFLHNTNSDISIETEEAITMKNCVFQNYTEEKICLNFDVWKNPQVVLINCIFTQNKGGCIGATTADHTVICEGCTFVNNSSPKIGGAIYSKSPASITIKDTAFRSNRANNQGGAVYASISAITFKNVSFYDCYTHDGGLRKSQSYGGALYLSQDKKETFVISDLYFENCSALYSGGGLFINGYDTKDEKVNIPVVIKNCTFIGCSAGTEGGGISSGIQENFGDDSHGDNDLTLSNCTFIRCKANYGGGVNFQDGTESGDEETVITNCLFENCSGSDGSAVYSRSYKFQMNHTIFRSNKNVQSYLFIEMNEKDVYPDIQYCTFEYNENAKINMVSSELISFIHCNFTANKNYFGGALEVSDIWAAKDLKFISCTFTNNTAEMNGGSVCIFTNTPVVFDLCTFWRGSAEEGGAIFMRGLGSPKVQSRGRRSGRMFEDNQTIPTPSPTPDVDPTVYSIAITNCAFYLCHANLTGGAIWSSSTNFKLERCNFTQTTANQKGAILSIELRGNTTIGQNNIYYEKVAGVSAFYFFGESNSSVVRLKGGCYTTGKRPTNDSGADYIVYNSSSQIIFGDNPCFQGSMESAIQIVRGDVNINQGYFNCNKCNGVLPPIDGDSSDGGDSSHKKKVLSGGAIAGIVIALLVLIAAIIVVVILILRRRSSIEQPNKIESVSQEAEDETMSFTQSSTGAVEGHEQIWSGEYGTNDSPNILGKDGMVDDPFMKDFEEENH